MHRRNLLQGMAAAGLSLGPLARVAMADAPGGRWRRLESAHFIAYSSAAEGNARSELAALEAFHGLLSKLMPPAQGSGSLKLPVYFAASVHDFETTAPWAGDTVDGFYTANLEEIRAVVAVSKGRERQADMGQTGGRIRNSLAGRASDPRLILFHEYVHHFMYANMRAAYPPWYVEGFAEYLSTAQFAGEGVYLGKATVDRASWLQNGGWLPVEKLLTNRPLEKMSDIQTALFYAQAWLAVHFFFNRPERAKGFDRYIRALTAGGDLTGAFQPAFGISIADFDKELRAYRDGNLEFRLWPDVKIDTGIPISVERLGASADDLLMPASYVRGRPSDAKTGVASLKSIRAIAKRYPDDAYAIRAQATAEIWFGDLGAARQTLDGLLKTDAMNAETHHLSGLCTLRAGYAAKDRDKIVAAAADFARAHELDASRASSLFRYAECKLFDGGGIDDHLLDILFAAYQLAPQVDSISMLLAQGLMQHKRFEEAVLVLRPLASDAHGGDMSDKADEVIASALAGKQTGMTLYGSAADAA